MLKFLVIIIPLALNYIYRTNTNFQKNIQIKNKHILPVGIGYYYITDSENKTYLSNSKLWESLDINQNYNIQGYGLSNKYIGLNPKITNIIIEE